MPPSHPVGPKLPPCPACQSGHTVQTSEHFGEFMFFCLDCEHTWAVHPGKLPPRLRTLAVSVASDDRAQALRGTRVRLARRRLTLAGRITAAQEVSIRLAAEFKARREVFVYLRGLIDRANAITGLVH